LLSYHSGKMKRSPTTPRRAPRRGPTTANILVAASLACLPLAIFALVLHEAPPRAPVILIMATLAMVVLSLLALHRENAKRMALVMANLAAAETQHRQALALVAEKSRLLATMSHEIRTPLNGVIGMLQLVAETSLTDEQKNYVATASASGRSLLSIIDEILNTSKAEALHTASPAPLHLLTVVENVIELLAPRAHAKDIEISAHIDADVPETVIFSDLKLRQILFNIAGNAIKFTQKGGVGISFSRADKDLQIVISDSGIGMSAEALARVFKPYVQAADDIATRFGGTGLGLGITQNLIAACGGSLRVDSTLAVGSQFTITLPQVLASGPAPVQVQPLAGRKFAIAFQPGVTRDHLAKDLQNLGAEVECVTAPQLQALLISGPISTMLVADSSQAAVLRRWAAGLRSRKSVPLQVWVMLRAEERQAMSDLIGGPFAGYLLKPLRRSTLLTQLTAMDDYLVKTAASQLRTLTNRQRPQAARNILVAEDNAVNMLLLKTLLEKAGHQVECVRDGRAAVTRLAHKHRFHLAILDLHMPGLDGIEATRHIRSEEKRRHVARPLPILALTASIDKRDAANCLAAGMNAILSKPFDQHDLSEAIARILAARAA
jgi:signal transduction histidine kinase/CheY-like chemotaxis protein